MAKSLGGEMIFYGVKAIMSCIGKNEFFTVENVIFRFLIFLVLLVTTVIILYKCICQRQNIKDETLTCFIFRLTCPGKRYNECTIPPSHAGCKCVLVTVQD